mgnify:CR=1 FL=1
MKGKTGAGTDRHTNKCADGQTDRQTDRRKDRQTNDKRRHKQTNKRVLGQTHGPTDVGLHPKSITAALNNDWENVKSPRALRKRVEAFRALTRAGRLAYLGTTMLYVYTALGEQEDHDPEDEVHVQNPELEHSDAEAYLSDATENDSACPATYWNKAGERLGAPDDSFLETEDSKACIPEGLEESRMTRDMPDCERMYSVNFGALKRKPPILLLFHRTATHNFPMVLYFITAKEDGTCYYNRHPLIRSASARWLLGVEGITGETLFARLQLFLSPSYTVGLPPNSITVVVWYPGVDYKRNDNDVDPFDGIGWVGLGLAAKLLKRSVASLLGLYPPFQFRGLVWCGALLRTLLVKGVLMIDGSLDDMALLLTDSCVKASRSGISNDTRLVYGIDVTQEFSTAVKEPTLAPFLLQACELRILAQPTAERREQASKLLEEVVQAGVEALPGSLLRQAYALPKAKRAKLSPQCQERMVGDPKNYLHDCLEAPEGSLCKRWHQRVARAIAKHDGDMAEPLTALRTPYAEISCNAAVFEEDQATPWEVLAETKVEVKAYAAGRLRTKDSFKRGTARFSGLYFKQIRSPRFPFTGKGITGVALVDKTGILRENQCVVMQGGVAHIGEAVMYRCPTHAPWDIQVTMAVDPPTSWLKLWKTLPDNCIVLSRWGAVNTAMAGGDLDGDLNMVVFDDKFLRFVKFTDAAVRGLGRIKIEQSCHATMAAIGLKAPKPLKSTSVAARADEYIAFACKVCTRGIRGVMASMASRAAYRAVANTSPGLHDYALHIALCFVVLAHLSFDVPKKLSHQDVERYAKELRACGEFNLSSLQLVERIGQRMVVYVRQMHVDRKHVPQTTAPMLHEILGSQPLGLIWVPDQEVRLGFAAGRSIGELLVASTKNQKWLDRSVERSPLMELARFFAHRLCRRDFFLRKAIEDSDGDAIWEALRTDYARGVGSWLTLDRSGL